MGGISRILLLFIGLLLHLLQVPLQSLIVDSVFDCGAPAVSTSSQFFPSSSSSRHSTQIKSKQLHCRSLQQKLTFHHPVHLQVQARTQRQVHHRAHRLAPVQADFALFDHVMGSNRTKAANLGANLVVVVALFGATL
jgi:hypothetical protein